MIKTLDDLLKYRPIEYGQFFWFGDNGKRIRTYVIPESELDFYKDNISEIKKSPTDGRLYEIGNYVSNLEEHIVMFTVYRDIDIDKIIKLNNIISSLTFTGFIDDLKKDKNLKSFIINTADIIFGQVENRKKEAEYNRYEKEKLAIHEAVMEYKKENEKYNYRLSGMRTPWINELNDNDFMIHDDAIEKDTNEYITENKSSLYEKNNDGSRKNQHQVPRYTELNKKKRGH